jgi:hypothetical protein
MVSLPGYFLLNKIIGHRALTNIRPLQKLLLCFFSGSAIWQVLLLILGFFNLYYYWLVTILTIIVVSSGYNYVRQSGREVRGEIGNCESAGDRKIPVSNLLLLLSFGIFAAGLLIVKGLYPAGGHDFFNHYHSYYEAVLRNHGIWPNDVWYQFYYSKGMGLFFLSMLLTDPLAPSLVTYCFAIAAALAVYLIVRSTSPQRSLWPWLAATAFVALYIYTPGAGVFLENGGWGDFQKPHEIDTAIVVAVVWMCASILQAADEERPAWFWTCALSLFVVAYVETVSSFVLGLFVTILLAGSLIVRRRREAVMFFAFGAAAGLGLLSVFALNYVMSGLISDQLALQTWPIVDVRRLAEWGALPHVISDIWGVVATRAQATAVPFDKSAFFYLGQVLKLDVLRNILLGCAGLMALWLLGRVASRQWRHRDASWLVILVILAFVASVLAAAAGPGMGQQISFVRYCSFNLPLLLALACAVAGLICAQLPESWFRGVACAGLPVALMIATLAQQKAANGDQLRWVIGDGVKFVDGAYSISDAYSDQRGWPGRMPYGAIFPGMIGAWRTIGPNTRMWSFHLWTYCMLPQCRSETYFSFILSRRFLDVLFAHPEEEKAILAREGLNYFFFTTKMPIKDVLPQTALFAPDEIGKHLGIKWTDGSSYLLTWLGPGVKPLSPEWLAVYRQAQEKRLSTGYPIPLMEGVRMELTDDPHWGSQLPLTKLLDDLLKVQTPANNKVR